MPWAHLRWGAYYKSPMLLLLFYFILLLLSSLKSGVIQYDAFLSFSSLFLCVFQRRGGISYERADKNAIYVRALGELLCTRHIFCLLINLVRNCNNVTTRFLS